jgi:hypothetical protein
MIKVIEMTSAKPSQLQNHHNQLFLSLLDAIQEEKAQQIRRDDLKKASQDLLKTSSIADDEPIKDPVEDVSNFISQTRLKALNRARKYVQTTSHTNRSKIADNLTSPKMSLVDQDNTIIVSNFFCQKNTL